MLRRRGGTWCSLDASEKAVASIRRIVGERVYLYDGSTLPFDDNVFDAVVIIDMLEHLEDDRGFIAECHRILKPAGCLIVNVPHTRRGQFLRPLRRLIGLTDERHGHVRTGYSERELFDVLKDGFDVQEVRTYSRFFVELIDTAVQFAALRVSGGHDRKGVMLDENDYRKMRKAFRLYSLLYPFFWLAAQIDRLLFFTTGYSLIVRAKRRLWIPRTTPVLRDGRSIAEATLRTQIGSASVLADLRKPGRG
jgi:SAM-dependent methyltransferase